jgi:hypothetical protein
MNMPFRFLRSLFTAPTITNHLQSLSETLRAEYPHLNIEITYLNPYLRIELGPYGNRYTYPLISFDINEARIAIDSYLNERYVMTYEQAYAYVTGYFGPRIGSQIQADIRISEANAGYDLRVFDVASGRVSSRFIPHDQLIRAHLSEAIRSAIVYPSNPISYQHGTWYRLGDEMVITTGLRPNEFTENTLPPGYDYVTNSLQCQLTDGIIYTYKVKVRSWAPGPGLSKKPNYKNKKRASGASLP